MASGVEQAGVLFNALSGAGAKPAGIFTQSSMRIEKQYLAYGHDLDTDTNPFQADLRFAIDWNSDFIGKTTSAAFGYRIGKPVAITQIKISPGQSIANLSMEVDIARSNFSGNISLTCAYDPEGLRMPTKIESHA